MEKYYKNNSRDLWKRIIFSHQVNSGILYISRFLLFLYVYLFFSKCTYVCCDQSPPILRKLKEEEKVYSLHLYIYRVIYVCRFDRGSVFGVWHLVYCIFVQLRQSMSNNCLLTIFLQFVFVCLFALVTRLYPLNNF